MDCGVKRVVLNEYNIRMEKAAYLPIASGLLRAFAETNPDIKSNYEFMPFQYHMDSAANILANYAKYEEPSVAGFSLSMWNEQLNLVVAAEVKRRWPDCLIVFGGPHVPQHPQEYFKQYPFVDVAVRAEGEEAMSKILLRNLESRNFEGLTGVSWRNADGVCIRNEVNSHQPKDLDMYPSPYLEGLFDDIMREASAAGVSMQAIIETNRGCPFPCSFCYWGQGGLSRKYRFHGIERVFKEIEWAAQHKIRYLFNADSNFGMHKRDEEIAQLLIDTKKKYGFPEKFRTCFGKNADERIFMIASKLHDADLEKGITLAIQSNTPEVLKNINRQNIKMEAYRFLQTKFNERGVPVYTELILGLPGENMETWKAGIENLLQAGLKNQLFVYLCQVFPNTEMHDPEYQKRFGIQTHRIELNEIHGAIRTEDLTTEYEDIIIKTDAMTTEMWKKMVMLSWMTMVFHSLKIGFFAMLYVVKRHGQSYVDFINYACEYEKGSLLQREKREFMSQIDRLLAGKGRGRMVPGYSPIYWDEEEASFIRISENLDSYYVEFGTMLRDYLKDRGIVYDPVEVADVVYYQRLRIPSANDMAASITSFDTNVAEYFDRVLTDPIPLERKQQAVTIYARLYDGDRERFAKETIMWGRKSGTIMTKAVWNIEQLEAA